jgi:hypothetical protein
MILGMIINFTNQCISGRPATFFFFPRWMHFYRFPTIDENISGIYEAHAPVIQRDIMAR